MNRPIRRSSIKASKPQWRINRGECKDFNQATKDIFYACCGDAHVKKYDSSKMFDPLLKLYCGRPVMINDNIDVKNWKANGTMCFFQSVVLKSGVTFNDLERIVIDGYYVWCADTSQVEKLKLQVQDHPSKPVVYVEPVTPSLRAHFPLPIYGEVRKYTPRFWRAMKMTCFPLNCANARTIHKLQGRTIENLVISSWDYKKNWVYVALSRVKQLKGLFLRLPLDQGLCSVPCAKLRQFMEELRGKEIDMDYLDD